MDPALPPYVGLAPKMGHVPWSDPGKPGFLGPAHAPFLPNGDGKGDLILNGISLERLRDRRALLKSFDRFRRDADASGSMEGFDAFTQQAFGVLTSSRLAEALDLEREDPKLRDRYGRGTAANQLDGGPKLLDQFLLARRLVEAGVRCVTLAFSRWDWHSDNFKRGREDMPMLDQGVTALVEDLHQRGLDKDVSVIVWGEFGRTPLAQIIREDEGAGRDHHPDCFSMWMAGGGVRGGQVIGKTDEFGLNIVEDKVHVHDLQATLLHLLGLDHTRLTYRHMGRDFRLTDVGGELVKKALA